MAATPTRPRDRATIHEIDEALAWSSTMPANHRGKFWHLWINRLLDQRLRLTCNDPASTANNSPTTNQQPATPAKPNTPPPKHDATTHPSNQPHAADTAQPGGASA